MLHKIQLTMTIIFSLGILMVAIVVTGLTLSSSNSTLRQQVSVLVSANSKQLELNIDNYIREVQQKAALLFSSEDYYRREDRRPRYHGKFLGFRYRLQR